MGARIFGLSWLLAMVLWPALDVRADIPPPYEPYTIGVDVSEAEPFPVLGVPRNGSSAQVAGLRKGDRVIAINGLYAKTPAPFYYFVRGLQGPKDTMVRLVVLRQDSEVLVFDVRRRERVK